MSIITKKQLLEKVKTGEIGVSPALDTFQLQDHSIDLRLGFTFMIPKRWHLTTNGRESLDIPRPAGFHSPKQNSLALVWAWKVPP